MCIKIMILVLIIIIIIGEITDEIIVVVKMHGAKTIHLAKMSLNFLSSERQLKSFFTIFITKNIWGFAM